MDAERTIRLLSELRRDWQSKRGQAFFQGRDQWLNGVIKGIDLAIWLISTEDSRRKTRGD